MVDQVGCSDEDVSNAHELRWFCNLHKKLIMINTAFLLLIYKKTVKYYLYANGPKLHILDAVKHLDCEKKNNFSGLRFEYGER